MLTRPPAPCFAFLALPSIRDTQKAQADNAVLQERLDKQESEAAFLVTQLQAMKRQRDALAERYSMLQKSLAQTDAEGKRWACLPPCLLACLPACLPACLLQSPPLSVVACGRCEAR